MKTISNTELKEKLAAGGNFFVLDVRELDEYETGHVPGAIFAPWHTVKEKVAGIKHESELYLYCETGVRASRAAEDLDASGYTNIAIVKPGWAGWNL
jgi:rhodanese-related sulfurtransferase